MVCKRLCGIERGLESISGRLAQLRWKPRGQSFCCCPRLFAIVTAVAVAAIEPLGKLRSYGILLGVAFANRLFCEGRC